MESIREEAIQYLKELDWYPLYCGRFKESSWNKGVTIDSFLNEIAIEEFINRAFNWAQTDEGPMYWADKNGDWKRHVVSLREKYIGKTVEWKDKVIPSTSVPTDNLFYWDFTWGDTCIQSPGTGEPSEELDYTKIPWSTNYRKYEEKSSFIRKCVQIIPTTSVTVEIQTYRNPRVGELLPYYSPGPTATISLLVPRAFLRYIKI